MSQLQVTHKHYIGETKEFEIMDEMDGKEGFFIKIFFINTKVNMNSWQVTWDAIKQDIKDVVGVPIVMQNDLQHPSFSTQNFFAKGYIVDYQLDESKQEATVIARILDALTIKLIREKKVKFSSPAVVARDSLSLEEINGVDVLSRFIALHLALVANPAYGKDDAGIHGTCTGKGDTCTMKLKQLTAAIATTLVSESLNDCVARKIPILADEHPEWEQDKIIAVAHEMCREMTSSGSDSQKTGPLTQVPLLKLQASLNRIRSEAHQIERHASMPEHDGKWGYWINARGIDVFVAENQTVDEAINQQCPCAMKPQ